MSEYKMRMYVKKDNEMFFSIYDDVTKKEDNGIIYMFNTGERDDLGEYIYEGDILKIFEGYIASPQGAGFTNEKIDVVKSIDYFNNHIMRNADKLVILGNIHQNKELLKQSP